MKTLVILRFKYSSLGNSDRKFTSRFPIAFENLWPDMSFDDKA